MSKDWELEGKKKQLKGKIQEFTGEMLGDDSERMKGKLNQAAGNVQESLGQAGHKIDREAREPRVDRIDRDRL